MKMFIKKIPIVGRFSADISRRLTRYFRTFRGSEQYWIERYRTGGNSGTGSYNRLAEFKAEVLNAFVEKNAVRTIIEYGCGDGNQLKLAKYPAYIGFDVSPDAISLCKDIFSKDNSKTFRLMSEYRGETAQLTLSLDVIFHLVEDDVFYKYMERLFDSSEQFVVIYSSNTDVQDRTRAPHVRHRRFTNWVDEQRPGWNLLQYIPNRYPFAGNPDEESLADFYIYKKSQIGT